MDSIHFTKEAENMCAMFGHHYFKRKEFECHPSGLLVAEQDNVFFPGHNHTTHTKPEEMK